MKTANTRARRQQQTAYDSEGFFSAGTESNTEHEFLLLLPSSEAMQVEYVGI
jgi:hypothetical protein